MKGIEVVPQSFQPLHLHCQLARQTPAGLHPRVLQGAAYEILHRLEPTLADELHENQNSNFGVHWNSRKKALRLGFNAGQSTLELARLGNLGGQTILLGNDKSVIQAVEARTVKLHSLPQKGCLQIHFQTPAILRKTNRRPHLLPELDWLCASILRKTGFGEIEGVSVFEKFHVDRLQLESCNVEYGYQEETALVGTCRWAFADLTEEDQRFMARSLQAMQTLGVGSKTSMGFGAIKTTIF